MHIVLADLYMRAAMANGVRRPMVRMSSCQAIMDRSPCPAGRMRNVALFSNGAFLTCRNWTTSICHGRPVGRDLQRAHHPRIEHRRRLLLRQILPRLLVTFFLYLSAMLTALFTYSNIFDRFQTLAFLNEFSD